MMTKAAPRSDVDNYHTRADMDDASSLLAYLVCSPISIPSCVDLI